MSRDINDKKLDITEPNALREARSTSKVPLWQKPVPTGEPAFKRLPGGTAPGWMNGKADGDPGLPLGLDATPAPEPAKEKPVKKRRASRKRAK